MGSGTVAGRCRATSFPSGGPYLSQDFFGTNETTVVEEGRRRARRGKGNSSDKGGLAAPTRALRAAFKGEGDVTGANVCPPGDGGLVERPLEVLFSGLIK